MTEKYDGNGLFDEDENQPFKPYVLKNIGGHKVAVIGQSFPRTSNANPKKYFFPDWSFGLREEEMQEEIAQENSEAIETLEQTIQSKDEAFVVFKKAQEETMQKES